MNPTITRILMVLSGIATSAAAVETWNWRTALVWLGAVVTGIAAVNAPGTQAKAEAAALGKP